MKISRFHTALAIVAALVITVGCAAVGGRDEESPSQRRGPSAIEILPPALPVEPEVGPDGYSLNCKTDFCRQAWDQMRGVSSRAIAPAASAASASSQGGCPVVRLKLAKKKEAKPCPGTTAVPLASAASQSAPAIVPAAPLPPAPAASAPAFKLADPLTERVVSKQVGSYDWVWDRFGYTDGQLVYRPYYGTNKSVYMSSQEASFSYACPRLRVPETDHALRIKVTAAFNPSLLWETDYHRLVAIYGSIARPNGDKNIVAAEDVVLGVKTYIGQHQEVLCRLAGTKSLDELLHDPSLGAAGELNRYFRRDAHSAFDILVQTTSVELPEELLRALALKGRTK